MADLPLLHYETSVKGNTVNRMSVSVSTSRKIEHMYYFLKRKYTQVVSKLSMFSGWEMKQWGNLVSFLDDVCLKERNICSFWGREKMNISCFTWGIDCI